MTIQFKNAEGLKISCEIGYTLSGPFLTYFTPSTLYKLLRKESKNIRIFKKIKADTFLDYVQKFCKQPENQRYLVQRNTCKFATGGKKTVLNMEGLSKFAKENALNFQFCTQTLENFIKECNDRFKTKKTTDTNRLHSRKSIVVKKNILGYKLLADIKSGTITYFDHNIFTNLKKILNSVNVFYVMKLKDKRYYIGRALNLRFRVRLEKGKHDAF